MLTDKSEEREALALKFALLKRNAMAAPFEQAYEEHYQLREEASKFTSEEAPQGVREGGQIKAIHYREEEAIYVKASHDRVTVIFSTVFREETDRVFGKVFIQEFVDARRRAIQNAPQVLFRNDPPLELQEVEGVRSTGSGEIGYVTFGMWYCSGFQQCCTNEAQSFSLDILLPSEWAMSFLTSKLSVIISTIISRHPRLISTLVCENEPQTSFRVGFIHIASLRVVKLTIISSTSCQA